MAGALPPWHRDRPQRDTHRSDDTGQACARCGARIALGSFRYPPGAFVVLAWRDYPAGSWRTDRRPGCQRGDVAAA